MSGGQHDLLDAGLAQPIDHPHHKRHAGNVGGHLLTVRQYRSQARAAAAGEHNGFPDFTVGVAPQQTRP
jgi:hypothetical protein